MTHAELILYATPSGPLADQLGALNDELRIVGPTTAQTYPPHCTLTGFFHRPDAAIPRIVAEVEQAVADAGPCPDGGVEIVALRNETAWIGLELRSAWLLDLTERFVAIHRAEPDDDALRPKDWPHLSIAYGDGDMEPARARIDTIDTDLAVDWHIALWRRHDDGRWSRLP